MRKSSIGISMFLLVFLATCSHSSSADVITPEFEEHVRRGNSLEQAVIVARKGGSFQQQLDAANAFDKFCSRSDQQYSIKPLSAKMALADVYWANGQPAQAKQILATWYSGFDKAYSDGMRKIAALNAKSKARDPNEYELVTEPEDAFFNMNFYKGGPGTVTSNSRFITLVYLSELCKALGQTQEASTYLSMAAQVYKQNKERDFHSYSWAEAVDNAKIYSHQLWTALLRESHSLPAAQRVAHLKVMLNEAYKYGKENLCVAKTLYEMGRICKGAEAEPLLKKAVEIYWKNGSPDATEAAGYYMSCMRSQKRELEGQRFLDTLKSGAAQPKKQANAAASGIAHK